MTTTKPDKILSKAKFNEQQKNMLFPKAEIQGAERVPIQRQELLIALKDFLC